MLRRTVGLRLVPLLLALLVAGCGGGTALSEDPTSSPENNPLPANYKAEILAYLQTYLNVPTGVRNASIAEPVFTTIGGRKRYVVCLRYDAKRDDGQYGGLKDRVAVFYVGRFNEYLENGRETCANAQYQPFPELEHLSRRG